MLDWCRVCLKAKKEKDICDVKTYKNMDDKSFTDVILFCLDIQLTQDSDLSTKICLKCHKRIIAFYKFKTTALKNDIYAKSMRATYKIEPEWHNTNINIKLEEISISDNDENSVKTEEHQSDDELLSVIKKVKYEYVESEENDTTEPIKRPRGRPKKIQLESDKIETKQVCEECGKTVKNLKQHMQRHLPSDWQKRVQCDRCEKEFSSHGAKYKHVRRKHLGMTQHCNICNKTVANMKQHVLVVHNTESLPYACIACQRRFISKSRLDQHMLIHTKDRPHKCKTCEKRFRTKACMMIHTRQVHDKEKTHLCQFCSKTFFKKYHLQVHLRSHTKEKPYSCPECGKGFASSSILKDHQLIHGNVKMFNCTLCDMTFARRGYLHNHMVSHIKNKRFPCHYCDMKFHRSDHRKRHEFTAHLRHLNTKPDDTRSITNTN